MRDNKILKGLKICDTDPFCKCCPYKEIGCTDTLHLDAAKYIETLISKNKKSKGKFQKVKKELLALYSGAGITGEMKVPVEVIRQNIIDIFERINSND